MNLLWYTHAKKRALLCAGVTFALFIAIDWNNLADHTPNHLPHGPAPNSPCDWGCGRGDYIIRSRNCEYMEYHGNYLNLRNLLQLIQPIRIRCSTRTANTSTRMWKHYEHHIFDVSSLPSRVQWHSVVHGGLNFWEAGQLRHSHKGSGGTGGRKSQLAWEWKFPAASFSETDFATRCFWSFGDQRFSCCKPEIYIVKWHRSI